MPDSVRHWGYGTYPTLPLYPAVLRRLDGAALELTLRAVIQRLAHASDFQAAVVVDATGLAPGAISSFYVRRAED